MRLLFVFALSISFLFSKELKSITLEEAIEIALDNNKRNKVSKLALEVANAQYNQALSANYPTINAMLVGIRNNEDLNFQMKGNISLPSNTAKSLAMVEAMLGGLDATNARNYINSLPASTFSNASLSLDTDVKAAGRDTVKGSLNLQYPVYTGGKISAIIEQAKLNKQIAFNAMKREEENVVFDTKKYFYGYVLTNELHKIAKESYERMQFISDLTKKFYESGESLSVKKTDYLSVQVTVTLIESVVSKLEANRNLVKSALINSMGLSWDSDINISYTNRLVPPNYTLAKLVEDAYKTNKDINEMDIALKVTSEQIKEKKAGHYPTLAFMGEISQTYNSYKYGFLNEDQENRWNIGFAANLPLFDGFKTTSEVEEKVAQKKKMYLLRDMLKDAVAMQIKNELTNALIGFKQIKTLKKAKKLAKDSRELNIRAYQIEAVEPEDVVQSQYIEAYVKADYLKYVHDYLISLAKIDKLVGKELK
ncbi:TolC family protein [Arcobacter sp. YIC-464]|uniref:TolC family protein n=1 Tax=Arcobacter sp. YIC-464 TaxID=3376631 RepID=UPI003C279BE9